MPPVAEPLKAPIAAPNCTLGARDAYPPEHLEAERRCLTAAEKQARDRHGALAAAVVVREKAAAQIAR